MHASDQKKYITALKAKTYTNSTQLISYLDSCKFNISEIQPSVFADIIYIRRKDESYNNIDVANALNAFTQNWTKAIAHKINEFEKKELVDSIWALGHISVQPDTKFICEWIVRAEALLDGFNTRDLTVSLLALSKIQSEDTIPSVQNWTALEQKYMTLANEYSESFESTITGHGILNINIMDEFLYNWHAMAINTINNCSAKDLCQNIYALKTLNFKPSDKFIDAWQSNAVNDISNFNSQALANSIYAFAKLEIKPNDAFLDAWHNKAQEDISIIGDI